MAFVSNFFVSLASSLVSSTSPLIVCTLNLLCPAPMTPRKGGRWKCQNSVIAKELFSLSETERLALYHAFVDNF